MRGVVSLAAALAVPIAFDNGTAFPQRNLILFITFVVILLTLVVQGLTLPYFIKRGGVFSNFNEEPEVIAKRKLKRDLHGHILQFLKNKQEQELHHRTEIQKLLQHWEEKSKVSDENEWMNEKTKLIVVELLESQRQYLIALNKEPEINEEIIRSMLYQLDLEEERIKVV